MSHINLTLSGKPEAFTFLGLQHNCGKNGLGRFEVRRITDGKRRRKKLQELKQELRRTGCTRRLPRSEDGCRAFCAAITITPRYREFANTISISAPGDPPLVQDTVPAVNGHLPGRSWVPSSTTGSSFLLCVSTPDAVWGHIQVKNRTQ